MYAGKNKPEILTTRKKPLFLKLRFDKNLTSDVFHDRLARVFDWIFCAAIFALIFSSRPVIFTQTKDKLLELACSMWSTIMQLN